MSLLTKAVLPKKRFSEYSSFISTKDFQTTIDLAKGLQSKRILFLSATSERGGVAELLRSLTPTLQDLGLQFDWYVLPHQQDQFIISRKFRDIFQGEGGFLSTAELKKYLEFNALIAEEIDLLSYDLIIINDYQPLAVAHFLKKPSASLIWQFHMDFNFKTFSHQFRKFLITYLVPYKALIFYTNDCASHTLNLAAKSIVVPSAIDPLTFKNAPTPIHTRDAVFTTYNISVDRPLITQVSRFNKWKNPEGLLNSFMVLKKTYPDIQLAFVSHLVSEFDHEQTSIFAKLKKKARAAKDVHFVTTPEQHNEEIVSVFQDHSTIIVQNSVREGFGLTLTEAMWKGKPVVGGAGAGIKKQIDHGKNGLIAQNSQELTKHLASLLTDKKLRDSLGEAAHKKVSTYFLLPHFIRNYLTALQSVLSEK